jgi:hypothetical protein
MSKTRQRKKQKIRDNLLKFYNKHTQTGSPIQRQKIFKSIGQNKIEELDMPVIADQPYVVYKTRGFKSKNPQNYGYDDENS